MAVVSEKELRFAFPDDWCVIKYDDSSFYREHVKKCQGVKGADILADSGKDIFIIEVRDFRGHRIENKEHVSKGGLADEVAKKVTDTIAGLYGAYRHANDELQAFGNSLFRVHPPRVQVILFMEEDRPRTPHRSFKLVRSDLKTAISQRLRFLHVRCNVHGEEDLPSKYGWHVLK